MKNKIENVNVSLLKKAKLRLCATGIGVVLSMSLLNGCGFNNSNNINNESTEQIQLVPYEDNTTEELSEVLEIKSINSPDKKDRITVIRKGADDELAVLIDGFDINKVEKHMVKDEKKSGTVEYGISSYNMDKFIKFDADPNKKYHVEIDYKTKTISCDTDVKSINDKPVTNSRVK